MGSVTTFDRLFAEAAPLIEQGGHQLDGPPLEGGRWPVSVVLRPDRACAERLEQAMVEVEVAATALTERFVTAVMPPARIWSAAMSSSLRRMASGSASRAGA